MSGASAFAEEIGMSVGVVEQEVQQLPPLAPHRVAELHSQAAELAEEGDGERGTCVLHRPSVAKHSARVKRIANRWPTVVSSVIQANKISWRKIEC